MVLTAVSRRGLLQGGLALAPGLGPSAVAARSAEEFILHSGQVITLASSTEHASAIAVRGDRIVAVGQTRELLARRSPGARLVDLAGRSVIPGMIDVHAHMDREGLKTVFPSLGKVESIADIQDRIADLARRARPGEWIVTMPIGTPPFYDDHQPGALREGRWPTRHDLDRAAPRNPVYIRTIWGFWRGEPPIVSIANTLALRAAGMTRSTTSPVETVVIEKDLAGEPTGVFLEEELQPLAELLWFAEPTRFSPNTRRRTLPISTAAYHRFGTTGILEGHGVAAEVVTAYEQTHRDGALTMRSELPVSPNWRRMSDVDFEPFVRDWAGYFRNPGMGDDMLRVRGLYAQIVRRPSHDLRADLGYLGWSGHNYACGLEPARLKALAVACARNDVRLVINAGQSRGILDILEEVDRQLPLKGRRWALGHLGIHDRRAIEQMARLELACCVHSNASLYKFGDEDLEKLPPERHREIQPLRSFLDAGLHVAYESDNVPPSLFWSVWQAVGRRSRSDKVVAPEQAITRTEALRIGSLGGAWTCFDEQNRGTLEPGKLADLAILDANPLTVPEARLRDIQSVATMVGGRVVYQDKERFDPPLAQSGPSSAMAATSVGQGRIDGT